MDNLARFKTDNLLRRFDEKQQIERNAVLKKIESGRLDIEKKRESDLQKIINKYKALKENQEKAQKAELIQLEKGFLSFKPSSNLFGKSGYIGGTGESDSKQSREPSEQAEHEVVSHPFGKSKVAPKAHEEPSSQQDQDGEDGFHQVEMH